MDVADSQFIEEKVGHLFFVGMPGTYLDRRTRALLREVRPGGVVLSDRNIESAMQVAMLTAQIRDTLGDEVFVGVSQEGGVRDCFRHASTELMPSARAIGKAGRQELARKVGEITARQLRLLGFNMNFAPVLDLGGSSELKQLRSRTFGDAPAQVSRLAGAYLDGLQSNGVIGCGKHFPGMGGAKQTGSELFPVVNREWEDLSERDLVPFIDLMSHRPGERLHAVMLGDAAYPSLSDFVQQWYQHAANTATFGTHNRPASINRNIVWNFLRLTLKFDGMVITDAVEVMAGTRLSATESALEALEAGADMLLFDDEGPNILAARDAVVEAINRGRLQLEAINSTLHRIRNVRELLVTPEIFDEDEFNAVSLDISKLKASLDPEEEEPEAPDFKPLTRQAETLIETEIRSPESSSYSISLSTTPEQVTVGQSVQVRVELLNVPRGEGDFELPGDVVEIYCFISSDDGGLRVDGADWATIRFEPETGLPTTAAFTLQPYLRGERSYSVHLFAEGAESGQVASVERKGEITITAPRANETRPTVLSSFEVRVAPQPDFVLQVETNLPEGDDGRRELTYRLTSRLPSLQVNGLEVGRALLRAGEIPRLRALLASTIKSAGGLQPEDMRERMLSFGGYLFDRLFPADSAAGFHEAFRKAAGQLTTWLIIEDGVTWLPWELVAPYDEDVPTAFLGERFQLSRWVKGLGTTLYSEVPLGEIALAHYKFPESRKESEELTAWQLLLQAGDISSGVGKVVTPETPYYRLHLLRHAEVEKARRDIVARDEADATPSPSEDAKRAWLDMRLKRPVITLSVLGAGDGGGLEFKESWPLPERILPLLRAGASAVVAPWWSTDEAADRVFWSTFYDMLERRVALGDAVRRARFAVERSLPQRPDWLAYTLFGDPRARPYEPERSEGYTTLERLDSNDPLRVGQTCYVAASISRRPSVRHEERLVRAEQLPQQPMALFIVPGLQETIPEPIPMRPQGRNRVQARYKFKPREAGELLLIARLFDGDERLQSLQLRIMVENPSGGEKD